MFEISASLAEKNPRCPIWENESNISAIPEELLPLQTK